MEKSTPPAVTDAPLEVRTPLLTSAMMSAAELYAARAAGYIPIGAFVSVVAMSMGARGLGRSIRALFRRGEMTFVSQTAQHAYNLALTRVEEQAKAAGADLVLIHSRDVRDLGEIVEVACNATGLKKDGEFRPMTMATATN